MSWTDKIAENVFDARNLGANLKSWLEENQAEALAWASDGQPVAAVKDFFLSETNPTRFPAFQIVDLSVSEEMGEGDIDRATVSLTYEIALVDGDRARLSANAKIYALAFASMARNVPKTRLEINSKIIDEFDGRLAQVTTNYDQLRTNGSQFLQVFQTEIVWEFNYQR